MGFVIFFLIGVSMMALRILIDSPGFQRRWNALTSADQMAYILMLLTAPAVVATSIAEAALLVGMWGSNFTLLDKYGHFTGIDIAEPGDGTFIMLLLWAVSALFWILGTIAYMNSYPRGAWNFPSLLFGTSSQLGAIVAVAVYFAA